MKRLAYGVFAAGLTAVILTTPLSAQQNNANQNQAQNPNMAQFRLVILDQTGAGIPMAEVTVTPKAGGEPVFVAAVADRTLVP